MDIKTIQIKRMEHSLTCLKGQIELLKKEQFTAASIMLQTVSILEDELKELKENL